MWQAQRLHTDCWLHDFVHVWQCMREQAFRQQAKERRKQAQHDAAETQAQVQRLSKAVRSSKERAKSQEVCMKPRVKYSSWCHLVTVSNRRSRWTPGGGSGVQQALHREKSRAEKLARELRSATTRVEQLEMEAASQVRAGWW